MSIVHIDGELLRKMIVSGSNALNKNKDKVDALNVFPVPDGDTGTNMSLTFLAAAKEAERLHVPNVYDVAKAVSNGSLRGARGNSGVILSQLFRGFAKGLEGCVTATADDIANAFVKASEMAYKAVMKPKEGTILTIARAMAERAADVVFDTDDVAFLLSEVIQYGHEVLAQTTEMLPALKQAGVVDAGGCGLLCIWDAALKSMNGLAEDDGVISDIAAVIAPSGQRSVFSAVPAEDIHFAYCTEFFICVRNATEAMEDQFKQYLSTVGDSIVAVSDDDLIKIHVHTNNPGTVLEKALTVGVLDNIKIENMRIQHTNKIAFEQPADRIKAQASGGPEGGVENKEVGFIVVSSGAGFKETFESLGADIVVEGGQTMNPSTEDFLEAIDRVRADYILLFPNNKNIILAAEQAAELTADKRVIVVPTKSVPQGVSALINYSELATAEENAEEMLEVIQQVRTGQITYAVRDTVLDGKKIKKDDILCMIDGKIVQVAQSIQQGAQALLDRMLRENGEVLSVFYGDSVAEESAQELLDYVAESYPDVETEVQYGGQPIYHYIFSVE